jgi:hypothetical protein
LARERKPGPGEREAALLAAARRELRAGTAQPAERAIASPAASPAAPPAVQSAAQSTVPGAGARTEGGLSPEAAQRIALLMAQAAEEKRRHRKRLRTWTLHLPAAVLVTAIAWVLWLLIGLLERTKI